jgi:hypothetical protein
MAENTKMPPNQDQRQRTPQADPNKSQKPGGPGSSAGNPDRSRQGSNIPAKPGQGQGQGQDMDPDRNRTQKPMPGSDKDGEMAIDDLDDDDATAPNQRPRRDEQP